MKKCHLDGFDPLIDDVIIEVYYQDALNKIYVVSPAADETNKHLENFEKLPKKITFMSLRYLKYKHKFKKAVKQENTFVNRKNEEIE